MVYLEHSSTRFWRCENKSKTVISVQYGKCGMAGRTLLKNFVTANEANAYFVKLEATKRRDGFVDAKDPMAKNYCSNENFKRKQSIATTNKNKKVKTTKVSNSPIGMKSIPSSTTHTVIREVDQAASLDLKNGSIHGHFDVMLNKTDIQQNNNKFYKIQLVKTSTGVVLFTKWGRVGERGSTQESKSMDANVARKEFEKKFTSKTGNRWQNRNNLQTKPGKYSIVEMEVDPVKVDQMKAKLGNTVSPKPTLPSKLDPVTKSLVDLIFDADMFKDAMTALNVDVQKLPLGALSKAQITKGFKILEHLEKEVNKKTPNSDNLTTLTSEFYTAIPHAFGRRRGPLLNTIYEIKQKYEMLNTLTDIETARVMQNNSNAEEEDLRDHPSDSHYNQLCADLTLIDKYKQEDEYSILETYMKHTGSSCMKLRNIWKVNRHNECTRFAKHNDLSNRKLLWHGTNVAVVAAILKSGLRIMPHSGGRVGSGIYLADQHEKSAQYVRGAANGTAIMFLVEAALGKQHEIVYDDSTLKAAPDGFDSVLAKGRKAPKEDKAIKNFDIDGHVVKIPQGKPEAVVSAAGSSFMHNEYLIYNESQHRIRYILTFDVV